MNRRALIVGLGISGMSTAISLKKIGWTPIIVERASERRTGGYFIGLRDDGKNALETLGVLDNMPKRTPKNAQFWDIKKDGSRSPVADLTNESNAPIAVLRGDIEEALWEHVKNTVEVRFDTSPKSIKDNTDNATVQLQTGDGETYEESFDLVIGADGVRSTVRKMVFGPDEDYMDPLGTNLCAFPLTNPLKDVAPGHGVLIAQGGRSLCVFPLADRPSTALFSYRSKQPHQHGAPKPVELLRRTFDGMDVDGIITSAIDDLERTDDYQFDSVQMIKMPTWSKGHVVLVGDSAWCLTLYSGMGASAGLMGGVALGEALSANQNVHEALKNFEEKLRPFVKKHQRFIALRSQLFVPSNSFFISIRRILWKIMMLIRNK